MRPRLLLSLLSGAAMVLASVPVWAQAPASAPALSLIAQAQQCDGGSNCPYFNDVYQADPVFRRAFDVAIKQAGLRRQYWVRKGVTTPLRPVEIEGKPRLLSSVCEPHNCGHHYSVLYDPASHSMAGVYLGPDGKGGVRTVYFGDPSIAEAAVLNKN